MQEGVLDGVGEEVVGVGVGGVESREGKRAESKNERVDIQEVDNRRQQTKKVSAFSKERRTESMLEWTAPGRGSKALSHVVTVEGLNCQGGGIEWTEVWGLMHYK